MEVAINAQLVSFAHSYRNAGISRYTLTLLEGLGQLPVSQEKHQEQRYAVFIGAHEAAAAAQSPLARISRMRLVPSRWPTGNAPMRVAWEQLALPRELRRVGAAVFHSPANILPARVHCAAVVTVHDLAFMRHPRFFRPTRRHYQRILSARSVRRATLIASVSQSTKRDLVECLHVAPERIQVIYTAVAPDFRPVADPGILAAFRARQRLPERYLLYLGTLEPRKNLERLIDAYAQALSAEPQLPPLVIAGGKGWYYEPIFERVRRLGLERAITFVGYVSREDQPLWYAGAAVFIYPSMYEGFGLPVLEALACGTATITSNVSSLPEAGGPVALQVAPLDVAALAQAIRTHWRDDAARRRAAIEGPRWAAQFTLERMARGYRELYRRAARQGSRHGSGLDGGAWEA